MIRDDPVEIDASLQAKGGSIPINCHHPYLKQPQTAPPRSSTEPSDMRRKPPKNLGMFEKSTQVVYRCRVFMVGFIWLSCGCIILIQPVIEN